MGHYWLLSLFSGLLLVFSFPGADLSFLAWVGLIPFLFLIQEVKTGKQLFFFSLLTGFFFHAGLLYWLLFASPWTWEAWFTNVGVVAGYFLLSLLMGLYFYMVAWPCWFLRRKRNLSFIGSLPVVWCAMEYAKSHFYTGFPWGLLGASQYQHLPLIQIAEWTGVYGVGFIVALGNAWLFEILYTFFKKRKKIKLTEFAFPPLLLASVLFFGFILLNKTESQEKPLTLTLIQGNIPQDIKWSDEYTQYIRDEYRTLTQQALQKGGKPDLVIWPETAMPSYLRFEHEDLELVADLIKESRLPFLVGSSDALQVIEKENPVVHYYNTAFLIEPGKGFTQQYNKIHLVPFGEYMPWWLFSLRSLTPADDDYYPGKEYTVFNFKSPFSTVICYEDIFPDLVRRFVKNGATWLLNLTNDGWFKNSSAPIQHNIHAVFRAVENRVWMVRCTNTGVSCFINPKGKIVSQVQDRSGKNIWLSGWLTDTLYASTKKTFYTQYGDLFSWLMLAISFCAIAVSFIRRKNERI